MSCIWSGYIHCKEDIGELVETASKTRHDRIEVVRKELRDLAEVATLLEDYIARRSVPWVGVFV